MVTSTSAAKPEPIPVAVERVASHIVDASLKVHSALGPGLLENAYEACLAHELMKRGLSVARQVDMPVVYDGAQLDVGYRLDLLVEKFVIVEVKAVELLMHIHQAQLMTYLRMSRLRLGFVINFNVKLIRDGIKRIVL